MMKSAFALGAVLAAVVLLGGGSSAQGYRWPSSFTYAYVAITHGEVEIAHIEGERCRLEPVTLSDQARFDIQPADTRLSAAVAAIRRLGAGGWEMVGDGFAYCHPTLSTRAIHFRKVRF